jgi:hypothetical protein
LKNLGHKHQVGTAHAQSQANLALQSEQPELTADRARKSGKDELRKPPITTIERPTDERIGDAPG